MSGIELTSGGAYDNAGTIVGVDYGVEIRGGVGSVTNSGTIGASAASGIGVNLQTGGTVANTLGGYIYGYGGGVLALGTGAVSNARGAVINGVDGSGVDLAGAKSSVTNAGNIEANGKAGVLLEDGGSVTNSSGGTISGGQYGILIESAAGIVTNAGGIYATANRLGGKTISVAFAGSGANTLTLQTGSVLDGVVEGSSATGATNALVLQGSGEASNTFYNFDTLSVRATGSWTLDATLSIAATTLTSGALVVDGALSTALTQSAGTVLVVAGALTLTGKTSLAAVMRGAGKLDLAGATTTISGAATILVPHWSVLAGANVVVLKKALTYSGVFSQAAGNVFDLAGGAFTLTGSATFSGGTVDGANTLFTRGTTEISALTIGGAATLTNSGAIDQEGNVTLGQPGGGTAAISNGSTGTYDILGDFGIGLGGSKACYVYNAGLFEKTFGTGTSAIAARVVGAGEVLVDSGTLSLTGAGSVLSGAIAGSGALLFAGGGATLAGGATVSVETLSETGAGTTLTISTDLAYSEEFTQGPRAVLSVAANDDFTLAGEASFSGSAKGFGTLSVTSRTTLQAGASISTSFLDVTGAGASLTLEEALTYYGGFSVTEDATVDLTTGALALKGAATFSDAEVRGAAWVATYGQTLVEGLRLSGASTFANHGTVKQSDDDVTLGDSSATDRSSIHNYAGAIWRIDDDHGIALAADQASSLINAGLFEKTGGTGVSKLASTVSNTGSLLVDCGTLELENVVSGIGADKISGAANLEFDGNVGSGQTIDFSGSGGKLILDDPLGFAGRISGFDVAGAGTDDTLQLGGVWQLRHYFENGQRTGGTLTLTSGSSVAAIGFVGAYVFEQFAAKSGAGGSTLVTLA